MRRGSNIKAFICIPTYNSAELVRDCIDDVLSFDMPVLIVNDGSNSESVSILDELNSGHKSVSLLTHNSNKGKGEAIKSSFIWGAEQGFDSVITIDVCREFSQKAIKPLVDSVFQEPESFWLAIRRRDGKLIQRIFRYFWRYVNNFWIKIFTGLQFIDVQSGYRAYPINAISKLSLSSKGYDFEPEVLLKAIWSGITVKEVALGVTRDATSRKRTLKDFLKISYVHVKAFFHRFLSPFAGAPIPGKSFGEKFKNLVVHEMKANLSPAQAALSVSAGVFFGIFPIHGFQVVTLLFLTKPLKLNKPLAFLGVNISMPPLLPFLALAAFKVGAVITGTDLSGMTFQDNSTEYMVEYLWDFLIGSVILAPLMALITFLFLYPFFHVLQRQNSDDYSSGV